MTGKAAFLHAAKGTGQLPALKQLRDPQPGKPFGKGVDALVPSGRVKGQTGQLHVFEAETLPFQPFPPDGIRRPAKSVCQRRIGPNEQRFLQIGRVRHVVNAHVTLRSGTFRQGQALQYARLRLGTVIAPHKGADQTVRVRVRVPEKPAQPKEYRNPFSSMLIESKNLIFRGAPGTGKSYLAKEIAADIISNGYFDDYTLLTDEQKKQVEFVQFHPSYDYSDFVEGLRPKINDDGTMGFELQDGIFKKFVARARKNYEDSQKSRETVEKEVTVQESMTEFFSSVEFGVDTFKTINGNEFTITGVDDGHINISIPGNASVNRLALNLDEVRKMLESGQKFEK